MSFDDWDVVADAKSPCSISAVDTPRRARSRATPAPAIPPPMTTTSYSASSSGHGRLFIGSGTLAKGRGGAPRGPRVTRAGRRASRAGALSPPPRVGDLPGRATAEPARQAGLVHLERRRVMRTRASGRGRDAD